MTPQPEHVSVAVPLTQAVDHTRHVLFQPFDLGKWFVIGFCAWLAQLGRAKFGGTGLPTWDTSHTGDVRAWLEQAKEYVTGNWYWIFPTIIGVAVVALGLWVLILWLNSRGQFLFLHCVAVNRAEVVAPWHKFEREGNSLFWFRLVLGLVGLVPTVPLLVFLVLGAVRMTAAGEPSVAGILGLVGLGCLLSIVAFTFWLVGKLTIDFVVPIMFTRASQCLPAWSEFLKLLAANPGRFVLYYLFWILLTVVLSALVFALLVVTCCIACCVLAIPYLGTVLLLPILMFKRAYPAFYLAQYGREYNVFAPAAAGPLAGTGPTT